MQNSRFHAQLIISRLKKEYPDVKIALNHSNVWELLVATILSAQCTDKRVNEVTKTLFVKYPTIESLAHANLEELQQDIHSTGFYRNKAINIKKTANLVIKEFNGNVPDTMNELLTLAGVARKTANVVLGGAFGKQEGIVVDTHVRRLSQRLGLTKQTDPKKIEQDLIQLFEKKDWHLIALLLIQHGRQVCIARKPACNHCLLNKICPSAFDFPHFKKKK